MNIEIAIRILKELKNLYEAESTAHKFRGTLSIPVDDDDVDAIETLLTAYEKVKGENVKLRLQDIPLIEGELKAYKDRINELKQELEKEKEKNKELEEKIIHRYKRICPECNNSFIAKRNDTKYCQKCGKKVARKKYKEANKEKIREYSKLHMRKYRAKKKLLKEE